MVCTIVLFRGYLRWGRDGAAVQPEKGLGLPQNPQRQVHALLARFCFTNHSGLCPHTLITPYISRAYKRVPSGETINEVGRAH